MKLDTLKSSHSPLYVQVAETLRQRIARGRWKEGELLPTFDALADEFGVAKVTIRQAVKILEEEALVAPKRGRGTTVLAPSGLQRPLKVETTLNALVEMYSGDKPLVRNLEEREVTLPADQDIGNPFDSYRMIRRIHLRDDTPYCVITLYLASHVFAKHENRFRNELVLPVLFEDSELQIEMARQTMIISKCDLETASLLDLAIGDPMAEVRRVLCDAESNIVYLADVTYRGDIIRVEMDLLS